jgi:hypothetical protein
LDYDINGIAETVVVVATVFGTVLDAFFLMKNNLIFLAHTHGHALAHKLLYTPRSIARPPMPISYVYGACACVTQNV